MKKGFTLIELLAVIVILAIIALIAIPTISGLIEKARLGAVRDSVYNIIDAAELHFAIDDADVIDGELTFTCDGAKCTTSSGQELKFKGKVPSTGMIIASKDSSNAINIKIGNYCAFGSRDNIQVVKGDCVLEAGIYDSKYNLIASWTKLVNDYHLDIEKDYSDTWNVYNSNTSLYYILNHNPELSEINTIVIPNTITKIGNYAFAAAGYEVIGSGIFNLKSKITKIVIPESVTKIGIMAFQYLSKIKEIEILGSDVDISYNSFNDLNKLEKVTLGINTINSINDYFSSSKETINNIILTDSVMNIEPDAFGSLYQLKNIKVDSNNTNFKSVNGILYNKDMTKIICYPSGKSNTTFIIPNTVTSIEDFAFASSLSLNSVTIPSSVHYVGYGAFGYSENLNSVIFETKKGWILVTYNDDDTESRIDVDSSDYSLEDPASAAELLKNGSGIYLTHN